MLYSYWGGIKDNPEVSALGFGTNHYDTQNISNSIELTEYAIEKGINYFDEAPVYSGGFVEQILAEAIKNYSDRKLYIAAKTGLSIDKTADDIMKRIEKSADNLGIDNFEFFNIWSLMSLQQYDEIRSSNGLYEGLLKAKEHGLVKHIGISLHCDVESVLKIVNDGLFEGITISFNASNYEKWIPVLKVCKEKKVGIATMNSLAGGMIPKYRKLFEELSVTDKNIAVKALQFNQSFEAVNTCLSSMRSKEEIDINCQAFENEDFDKDVNKYFEIKLNENLCSGCGYCMPCSADIVIPNYMQAYNHKVLTDAANNDESEKNIANDIFKRIRASGSDFLIDKNCIKCHKCERKCTQGISISERMSKIIDFSEKYNFSEVKVKERFKEIEDIIGDDALAIWPSHSLYTNNVLDLWDNKNVENNCFFVNNSSTLGGKTNYRGRAVLSAKQLYNSDIKNVLVISYLHGQEIIDGIDKKWVEQNNVKIISFHKENDVSWFDM